MTEIWTEFTKSNPTSQRITNRTRMILKKGRPFDLEILEIYGHVSREE